MLGKHNISKGKPMNFYKTTLLSIFIFTIYGCSTGNYVTKEEIVNQNNASEAVTNTLFNNDLDEAATYSISKEGHVDINFDKSVPEQTYTSVVTQLRKNSYIKSVWATQGGVEVCPLP